MKLATETASLVNHLYARSVIGQPEPEVGMGATMLMWSDRKPATVVDVRTGRQGRVTVVVQQDEAIITGGSVQDGTAAHRYERDPNGWRLVFERQANGRWRQLVLNERGKPIFSEDGLGLRLGERDRYIDPTF